MMFVNPGSDVVSRDVPAPPDAGRLIAWFVGEMDVTPLESTEITLSEPERPVAPIAAMYCAG